MTHGPRLDLLNLSSVLSSSLQGSAGLINLTNLLSTQALVNPQLLKLASTLSLLKQENPELYLQIQQGQNQVPLSQNNAPNQMEQLSNVTSFGCQNLQQMFVPSLSNNSLVSELNQVYYSGANNDSNNLVSGNLNQNFGYDSVKSTPSTSSTDPLNSGSVFMNGSTEDYERESYCNSLLKFEVPEGFDDISDFL